MAKSSQGQSTTFLYLPMDDHHFGCIKKFLKMNWLAEVLFTSMAAE
jgi:hypothetical protein